jgi:DNA primase
MQTYEEVFSIATRFLRNVKKSGPENIMATCPFHPMGERVTATLTMSLGRGLFYCFSCHERGTMAGFLRKMGMPFTVIDTNYRFLLEELAKSAPPKKDRALLNFLSNEPLPERVLGLFDYCPQDLLDAGFAEKTLADFDIGVDFEHSRITFPLRDTHGTLVGISGRLLDAPEYVKFRYKIYDKEYKKLGFDERSLDKRNILWNAHRVFPVAYYGSTRTPVVLVEGFKACMWVYQAGYKNVMALLGSAVTEEQHAILEYLGCEVTLFLDNNKAGKNGTKHYAPILSASMPVKIVEYPDEREQPDALTAEEVCECIDSAKNYSSWILNRS